MKTLLKTTFLIGLVSAVFISCQKREAVPVLAGNGLSFKQNVRLSADYSVLINKEIAFILSCQLPSGAIMTNPDAGSKISGYFANIACLGVLESPTTANISAVKKWMIWYMNHLNGTTNPVTHGPE
ncbi:MAG: hypothetical protein M3N14_00150, partial [Bacteroidota bacterium]|nr:hypothetical protein [Bacteroidota bacterium]